MNSESQFLTKKRSSKEQEVELNSKSIIKKFSKKIRQIHKDFKLEKDQEKKIIQRIFKACEEKSENESLYNIFSNEFPDIDLEKLEQNDIEDFMKPVRFKVYSHTIKRRIYDIDSNKKLLRKNIWNYTENQIFELSYIKNIKSVNNHIKHNTKKDFEKNLMDTKIKELYDKHYNIKVEYILENIDNKKNQQNKKEKNDKKDVTTTKYDHLSKSEKEIILNDLLDRTFKDFFIEYRNSTKFWEEAKEDCKDDNKKLVNYIQMAMKFINYVNNSEKANLANLDDDDELSEDFRRNYATISSNIPLEEESNMNANFNSNFITEEINRNKTTISVTQQINTIMSLTPNHEKLNTYLQIFKELDSNEQSRLFSNINNYMKDVNQNVEVNNNINLNTTNLDIISSTDNFAFNFIKTDSLLNVDENEENKPINYYFENI
jgi:hypothetical protein